MGEVIWCQMGGLINEISTYGIPPKISPSSWSQGYEHSWDQGMTQTGRCLEGRHTEQFCRSGSLTHTFWKVRWFTLRDQRQHGRVMSRDSDPNGQPVRGRAEIPQRYIREGSIFLSHHVKNLKAVCLSSFAQLPSSSKMASQRPYSYLINVCLTTFLRC